MSQVRTYEAEPLCFIGGPHRAVPLVFLNCDPVVDTWMASDDELSGCRIARCYPAPPATLVNLSMPLSISLNGQCVRTPRRMRIGVGVGHSQSTQPGCPCMDGGGSSTAPCC